MYQSKCFIATKRASLFRGCVLLLLLSPVLVMADLAPADLVLYLPLEKADNPTDTSADPTSLVVHGSLSSVDGKFGTLRGLGAGP